MEATASTPTRSAPAPRRKQPFRSLEDLVYLGPEDLAHLYRTAETPRLSDLDGDLGGRMLALPRAGRSLASVVRTLGAWDRFPWRGKSFRSTDDAHGEGFNRYVTGRIHLHRFTTSIGASRAGDFDAVQLDYDRRDNPFFVRRIKDEVRAIEPGLFLGTAWMTGQGRPRLACYFGLTTR
ncbi:MAG TPA: hypothetical protein VF765_10470 [Polyangiaceae bacterium]